MSRAFKGTRLLVYLMVAAAFATTSIYLFFFRQFDSRFTVLFGDEYDAVIESVLLSHWHHVINLTQYWNQPPYFYPYRDVLGYNDGYFLTGLIAALFRLCGLSLLISQEMTHVTIKLVGFLSMLRLIHFLKARSITALLGATLFTLFISSTNQAVHGQLFDISLCPLLTLMLLSFIRSILIQSSTGTLLFGFLVGTSYNVLLMTGFYTAWISLVFFIIFACVALYLNKKFALRLLKAAFHLWKELSLAAFAFVIETLPFLSVYLKKLHETGGGQSYAAQLHFSLRFFDILNIGPGSVIWGGFFNLISQSYPLSFRPGEFRVGITPDVAILFTIAVFWAFTSKQSDGVQFLKALVFSTCVGLLLPVSVLGYSLWYLLDLLVPGAHGLRVIARIYIFLSVPITIMICMCAEKIYCDAREYALLFYVAFAVACISQVNLAAPTQLNVAHEMALLSSAKRPPAGCRSFFVSDPLPAPITPADFYARQNVEAMFLADHWNMPTINGLATFNPPDWGFAQSPNYLNQVKDYVSAHHISSICQYIIAASKWVRYADIDFYQNVPLFQADKDVDLSDVGRHGSILLSGWSTPENWGVWSDANKATLGIRIKSLNRGSLVFAFTSHAFVSPHHLAVKVDISANARYLESFLYTYPADTVSATRYVIIPGSVSAAAKSDLLLITFSISTPTSPLALGMGPDGRALGIGLQTLRVSTRPNFVAKRGRS